LIIFQFLCLPPGRTRLNFAARLIGNTLLQTEICGNRVMTMAGTLNPGNFRLKCTSRMPRNCRLAKENNKKPAGTPDFFRLYYQHCHLLRADILAGYRKAVAAV
jgi:hypothetical protein